MTVKEVHSSTDIFDMQHLTKFKDLPIQATWVCINIILKIFIIELWLTFFISKKFENCISFFLLHFKQFQFLLWKFSSKKICYAFDFYDWMKFWIVMRANIYTLFDFNDDMKTFENRGHLIIAIKPCIQLMIY